MPPAHGSFAGDWPGPRLLHEQQKYTAAGCYAKAFWNRHSAGTHTQPQISCRPRQAWAVRVHGANNLDSATLTRVS